MDARTGSSHTPVLSIREQLEQINRFLTDLDPESHRLSVVLHKANVSEQGIALLRSQYLAAYVSQLCERWRTYLATILPERHADILIRRYSLSGLAQPTLADLGQEYDISRERVRQLEDTGMRRLRNPRRRQELWRLAVQIVYEGTGLAPEVVAQSGNADQQPSSPLSARPEDCDVSSDEEC